MLVACIIPEEGIIPCVILHRGILVFSSSNVTVLPVKLTAVSFEAQKLELVSYKAQQNFECHTRNWCNFQCHRRNSLDFEPSSWLCWQQTMMAFEGQPNPRADHRKNASKVDRREQGRADTRPRTSRSAKQVALTLDHSTALHTNQ
jgi:hypothetical protein